MRHPVLVTAVLLLAFTSGCSSGTARDSGTGTVDAPQGTARPTLTGPRVRGVIRLRQGEETDADRQRVLEQAATIIEQRMSARGWQSAAHPEGVDSVAFEVAGPTRADDAKVFVMRGLLRFMQLKENAAGQVAVLGAEGLERYVDLDAPGGFVPFDIRTPPCGPPVPVGSECSVWVPVRAMGDDGTERDLTSAFIQSDVKAGGDPIGKPLLMITMTDEGAGMLEQASRRLLQQPIAFFLDDAPMLGADGHLLAPIVQDVLSRSVQITGLSADDASTLAILLRLGPLPASFDLSQLEAVSG